MEKIITSILCLFLVGYIHAQDIDQRNVPAVVLNAFQLQFPNASDVDWNIRNGNYYVEFEINNKDNDVLLDYRGALIKHKKDLFVSEIPGNVMKTIKTKVSFFDIKDRKI